MFIEINDSKTVEDISSSFTRFFPFLKLEFYDQPHNWQAKSSRKHLLSAHKTIGEIRKKHQPGVMEIHERDTTGVVEQEFKKHFGLNVQIWRHHGEEWIQTAGTDLLTIKEQNEIGENATVGLQNGAEIRFEREKRL